MGSIWRNSVAPRTDTWRHIRAVRSPFYEPRLAAASVLLEGRGHSAGWLRLFGIKVREAVDGDVFEVDLPNGLRVFVPRSPVAGEGQSAGNGAAELRGMMHIIRQTICADQYGALGTIRQGDTVIDCGANIGLFSVLAARCCGPDGLVVAIEPIAQNARCIERLMEANGIANVKVIPTAVGREVGTLELSLSRSGTGASSVISCSPVSVEVPVTTVDELAAELGLGKVDFVKMDVEGAEADAIQGSVDTIKTHRPHLRVSAYHLEEDQTALPRMIEEIGVGYGIEVRQLAALLEPILYARPTG